jgi:branched-chain amino acid transport system permease protein
MFAVPPYVDGLVTFGVIYVLLASAVHLTLLANYLMLSQIGLMLIAAYSSSALVLIGVPWIVAALAGVIASTIAAGLIGLLGLRLKDFPLAIASIAISEALRLTIVSTGILGGIAGLSGIPKETVGKLSRLVTTRYRLGRWDQIHFD